MDKFLQIFITLFEILLKKIFGEIEKEKEVENVEIVESSPAKEEIYRLISTRPAMGKKGDSVRALQEALKENGQNLAIDGIFGVETKRELSNFQKKHNISGVGAVNDATLEALKLKIVS